jgi:YggT family protein
MFSYGYPVQYTIRVILDLINLLILARAIISWLPVRDHPVIYFIYQVTEPVLAPVRNLISRSVIGGSMMFDFSPIIVWLIIDNIAKPLVRILIRF